MSFINVAAPPVSPLVLADRLITLAQDADRAGYRLQAEHLVSMVYSVLDTTGYGLPANGRGRRVRGSAPVSRLLPSAARPIRGPQRLPA